jgi:hypothetical protein
MVALVAGLALVAVGSPSRSGPAGGSGVAVGSHLPSQGASGSSGSQSAGASATSSTGALPSWLGTQAPIPASNAARSPVQGEWRRGGEAWLAGDIIATPGAFLAACALNEDAFYFDGDFSTCSSSDLVHWSSRPGRAVFVNEGSHPFLPVRAIQVKHGYAAVGLTSDGWEGIPSLEWYSADGVHWQEGIPADQLPDLPDPCVTDPSLAGVCKHSEFEVSDPESRTVVAVYYYVRAEDNRAWSGLRVSRDGGATWSEPRLDKDLWTVNAPPQRLPDGTWILVFELMSPAPPEGVVLAGDADRILVTSPDAIHWSKQPNSDKIVFLATLDSSIYATFGYYQSGNCDVEVSMDGGRTWLEVVGPAGEDLVGEYLQTVGGKVVVFEGLDYAPGRIMWVGP